jgi:uncharacterized membrane protein YfcA
VIVGEVFGLVGVGVLAGVVSTVVSLASVVSYPALLAFGLPPLTANVTNTVALLFTGVGAAAGSRPELAGQGRDTLRLSWVSALGGATGAALLLLTPARSFELIAPVLIAAASVLLLVRRPAGGPGGDHGVLMRVAVFGATIYVGYFGAAGGVLLLAALSPFLNHPLPRLNAIKNVLSGVANAVAALGYAVFGPVDWGAAVPLGLGFLVGGWLGPKIVRRLPGQTLRYLAAGCGVVVAIKLGWDTYTA